MTDTPTGKKLSERLSEKCQAWHLANELSDETAAARRESTGELMLRYIDAILAALRLAESHPSTIREAVEGEREACAKIAEGDLFEVRYRTWPHWNPGGNLSRERDVAQLAEATAAAIRARGEEKGNG